MKTKGCFVVILMSAFVFNALIADKLMARDIRLIGTDICSDGYSQSTVITLTDTSPDKIYSLFRDNQYLSSRQYNPGTTPAALELGEYAEPGVYTVVEFEQSAFNQKHDPRGGRQIPGKVTISREPEIFIRQKHKELEITSGTLFNYTPEANMEDVEFFWAASVTKGKLKDFEKEGRSNISLTPELAGTDQAEVVFQITPVAPDYKGGCTGRAVELKVKIISSKESE